MVCCRRTDSTPKGVGYTSELFIREMATSTQVKPLNNFHTATDIVPALPAASVHTPGERIVVTFSGKDRRTAASDIIAAVAASQAQLIDLRQTVVHGFLTLVTELNLPDAPSGSSSPIYKNLLSIANSLGLSADFHILNPQNGLSDASQARVHHVLTLMSQGSVTPAFLGQLADSLAERNFSTEKITQLSSEGLRSVELVVSASGDLTPAQLDDVRAELYALGNNEGLDVALQAESVLRRSKRLVVMDMDSTLIQQEVIDEIARYAGVYEQVEEITHRAMGGKLDFKQSLSQRVAFLKGASASVFDQVIANLQYTPGAKELCRTLKKLGYRLAVISGGFTKVTAHVRNELGLDYDYANQLEEVDGKFTGRTIGAVVNAQRKADLLMTIAQQERITLDQVIAIGDGANDLPMLGTAGLGVAFNAKPAVQEAANFRINQPSLTTVLFLLGLSEEEQEELRGSGGAAREKDLSCNSDSRGGQG